MEFERLRRERSWGTSFDRQGGGNSADRRGTAVPTIGSMWTRGVTNGGGLGQSLLNFPRGIVPKFPVECSPSEYIAWEQRFEFLIANQGLRHTISLDAPEIAVISCTNNAYLFGQFGEELILEHRQVWGYISDAVVDVCTSVTPSRMPFIQPSGIFLWQSWREFSSWGTKNQKLFSSFSASSRNVHRTPMLLSSVVVFGTGGPWAAVACLGSSSSCSTGFTTVVYRGSSSSSSSSSSNGLAAVVTLINTNVASILFLPPGRRNSSRHGFRQEVTGSTPGTPFQHLRLKRCPTPVSSPLRLRRLWRKRPRHQRARHRRQYLQQRRRPAVLFSPLHRWGGRPGRPLLQMKQRHRRRHRRPAVLFPRLHHLGGQSGRASRLLERRYRTLYRRRHRRPTVLFPRLHHLGGQSGRASRLLERRHRTLYRRRHWQPAVLLPRLHHLGRQSVRVSRLLERHHRTRQRRRFHSRSATTSTAVTAEATTAAAAATTPPAITTYGGKQPMLEHCCDPSIVGKDANGMRG